MRHPPGRDVQPDGLIVDTGQHVFLGCCSAYRGLLAKLGVTDHAPLQDRFDVTVLDPDRQGRLRRTSLPGPFICCRP